MRIDKYLKVSRIIKRRTLAKEATSADRILVNDKQVKPSYNVKTGDIIAYKQLQSLNNLISGEIYVVDFHLEGDDFEVVKYVQWEEENSSLRLVSYNQHHKDLIIPVSAVRAIALVKIVVRITSMV